MNKRAISLEIVELMKDSRQLKLEIGNMKRCESWQEGRVSGGKELSPHGSVQMLRPYKQQFNPMKVRKKEKNLKQQERIFVPFIQERDHIGRLLSINEGREGSNQDNSSFDYLKSLSKTNPKTAIERMIANYKKSSREISINHFISEKKDYRSKLDQIDVKYSLKVQPFREMLDSKIASTLEFKKGFKLSESSQNHSSAKKRQEQNAALLEIINRKGEKKENSKTKMNGCSGQNKSNLKINTEGSQGVVASDIRIIDHLFITDTYSKKNECSSSSFSQIIAKEDSYLDLLQLTNASKLSQSCYFESPAPYSKSPSDIQRHYVSKHKKKEENQSLSQPANDSFLSNTFQSIIEPSVFKRKQEPKKILLRSFTQDKYPNFVSQSEQQRQDSLIFKRCAGKSKMESQPVDCMNLVQANKKSKINVKSAYSKSFSLHKASSFNSNSSQFRFGDSRNPSQITENLFKPHYYPQSVSLTNQFQPFNSSSSTNSFNDHRNIKSNIIQYSKSLASSEEITRNDHESSEIQKCLTDIDDIDRMDLGFDRENSKELDGISLGDSLLRGNFSLTSQRMARIKRAITETVEATKKQFKNRKQQDEEESSISRRN